MNLTNTHINNQLYCYFKKKSKLPFEQIQFFVHIGAPKEKDDDNCISLKIDLFCLTVNKMIDIRL